MIFWGKRNSIGALVCLLVTCGALYKMSQDSSSIFQIIALDVGQGSAVYVQTQNGTELLLDTGPSLSSLRQLNRYRNVFDRTIDYLIISHIDMDHMAMAPVLLDRYNIRYFVTTADNSDSGLYSETVGVLKDTDTQIMIPEPGDSQVIDTGTYIQYLWPHSSGLGSLSQNDSSLVVRLVQGNVSVLYTGDISQSVEKQLVDTYGKQLQSDILIVSHHGSKTSTDYDFVKTVDPSYAVIQSGADNRYGHPHANTIDTLNRLGIPILRNDLLGSIEFITDGDNLLVQ